MRWAIIIVMYVVSGLVTVDSYGTKYQYKYNENPNPVISTISFIVWPLTLPAIFSVDWSKVKDKS